MCHIHTQIIISLKVQDFRVCQYIISSFTALNKVFQQLTSIWRAMLWLYHLLINFLFLLLCRKTCSWKCFHSIFAFVAVLHTLLYCVYCMWYATQSLTNKQTTKHSYTNTLPPTVPRHAFFTTPIIEHSLSLDNRLDPPWWYIPHMPCTYFTRGLNIALTNPSCLCILKKQKCLQSFDE